MKINFIFRIHIASLLVGAPIEFHQVIKSGCFDLGIGFNENNPLFERSVESKKGNIKKKLH